MGRKKLVYLGIAILAAVIVLGGIYRFTRLYGIKKQLMELDLQENELELRYRTGEMTFEEYLRQKSVLDSKEDHLEWQEDFWEFDFD